MSSPYNPLYNLGLLRQLNPMGQALGSAGATSSLPASVGSALAGGATNAYQPGPAVNPATQQPMQPPQQMPVNAPQLPPQQMAQNALAGVNAMQGAPGRPQNRWQQALGQMGNFMTGQQPAAGAPAGQQTPAGLKGTLGAIGQQMAGAGQQQGTTYPAAPKFEPLQLPQSQLVQGNPQSGQNWQALLAALNRNPYTGQ